MKIFVDFDDVIFNAKKFKEDLIKIFSKNGVTRHEFENSYYTYLKKDQEWGRYYNPKDQIRVLRRRGQIDHKRLSADIDLLMKDLSSYVFPDVLEYLGSFPKKDLFLITYGHEKFQKAKIRGTGIMKYFRKLFISKNNKINIILGAKREYNFPKKEKIIFIDDRPEQLERSEKAKKEIVTFRMRRKEGRYSDLICLHRDYEVNNLKEVAKIIKKENLK